jgi:hypothetical protein
MARVTLWVGALLIVVGIVAFVATGSKAPTALIPCWFGLVLAICGSLAATGETKKRMIVMHIAVTVGLLGFVFPAARSVMALVKAHGAPLARPIAVEEEVVMAVICLVFVVLCVRSFIAARKARLV